MAFSTVSDILEKMGIEEDLTTVSFATIISCFTSLDFVKFVECEFVLSKFVYE